MSRYNNRILDSIGTEVSYSAVSDMSESKNFLNKNIARPILQNMPDFQSGGFMNFLFGPNDAGTNANATNGSMMGNMSRSIPRNISEAPRDLMNALENAKTEGYAVFNEIANSIPTKKINVNYVNNKKENILHVLVDNIAELENKIQGDMQSYNNESMTLQNMKVMLDGLIAKNRDRGSSLHNGDDNDPRLP